METNKPQRPPADSRELVELVVITIVVFFILGTAKYLAIKCGLVSS